MATGCVSWAKDKATGVNDADGCKDRRQTSGEGTVPQARNFRIRPNGDTVVDVAGWRAEPRLPLRSRLIFILVAAATCWAVPLLLIYWLAR
jgi:hypothetical protein